MTTILPIKGLRFSTKTGIDYSRIITPPYDVINPQQQDAFYQKSPFNVIRLEYPKSLPDDNPKINKYTRAASTVKDWIEKGILVEEESPAIYLYEQHFFYHKNKHIRKGIFCGVELSPFEEGKVIPHEETMSKPKADRLELLRHCKINFSPIFGLFKDQQGAIDTYAGQFKKTQKPVINFIDEDGQQHILWAVTDNQFIAVVQEFFNEKKIYIADGHHRYETALQYYLEKKEEEKSKEKYGRALMALVNIYDEGLLAFPTHRLIAQSDIKNKELLDSLSKQFHLQEFPEPKNEEELQALLDRFLTGAAEENLSFGLYTSEKRFFILTLKNMLEEKKPSPWLDTVILQELVLSDIFNIKEAAIKKESRLVYLRDEWETKSQVDQGAAVFAFFLNRPPFETIINLAEKGIRMPQKSTYFFPKFVTGLVMLKLDTN